MLPDEVHDAPPAIALLDVADRERRHFGPPQPATQEDRQDRAVAEPLVVVASGVFSNVWACRTESQLPKRTPFDATPLTRVIPAANSGASNPLSAASTASLRTAVIRTLMETVPSPRASRATRQAATVAFVKPGRGSWPYHSKNSSSAWLYTRFVIGEETLSSTSAFNLCHSVICGTTIKSVI